MSPVFDISSSIKTSVTNDIQETKILITNMHDWFSFFLSIQETCVIICCSLLSFIPSDHFANLVYLCWREERKREEKRREKTSPWQSFLIRLVYDSNITFRVHYEVLRQNVYHKGMKRDKKCKKNITRCVWRHRCTPSVSDNLIPWVLVMSSEYPTRSCISDRSYTYLRFTGYYFGNT